ncbi:MAG: FecR domain-containing protein [Bacteroidota bacterium]
MKLSELVIRRLEGKITPEEENILGDWLEQSAANRELLERLEALKEEGVDMGQMSEFDAEIGLHNVFLEYSKERKRMRRKLLTKKSFRYAAVLVGIIFLVYGYSDFFGTEQSIPIPPEDVITLEMDNGEVHILTSEGTRAISDKKGNTIVRRNGNQLDYKDSEKPTEMVYNTLHIPYGERFVISLSDGTMVHLNAGSSLRYPVHFMKGRDRQVFLSGEAFFDVRENDQDRFVVTADQMNVSVFGTEFNVSAYPEDVSINTVLVEGSVGISSREDIGNGEGVRLKPGHMAHWDPRDKVTTISQVDTEVYTSWIHGRLVLKNHLFGDILKRLERHYNVTIENRYNPLNREVFTASFDTETIVEVLDAFSENKDFNFTMDNDKIIITAPMTE